MKFFGIILITIFITRNPLFLFFMNKCVSLYLSYVCNCPQMSEESVEVPRPGVTQTCELLALGAGNQTWVPWKWTFQLSSLHDVGSYKMVK